ncbi:DUF4007 family protein [Lysinibacillus boronitolerans]|uniref:DUF4007 family protein n=1 Tax=Lysinibacillus boronitolerans TaxID=309788 RepID=UPI0038535B3A
MAFGQHQTFYLRQQWLTKGLTEVRKNPRFFYEEEHFEVLGVGKNMAKSIRHWLNVTQLTEEKRSTKTEVVLSALGEIVYKHDYYVKYRFTLGLLHYLIVTEKKEATTWYWFFNIFNERIFTKALLIDSLEKWVKDNFEKSVSNTSLKRDIDCLLLLYCLKEYKKMTPEDVIKSPFEALKLVEETSAPYFVKNTVDAKNVMSQLLFVTLVKYMEKNQMNEVSLNELVNAPELWGKVFNLTRDAIIDNLVELQTKYGIEFTRTNRLDIVRLKEDISWIEAVQMIYENEVIA